MAPPRGAPGSEGEGETGIAAASKPEGLLPYLTAARGALLSNRNKKEDPTASTTTTNDGGDKGSGGNIDDVVGYYLRNNPSSALLCNNDTVISLAKSFLQTTCPELIQVLSNQKDDNTKSTEDRYIKIGRNIVATLRYDTLTKTDETKTNASLCTLVEECHGLSELLGGRGVSIPDQGKNNKVPKVRFGKTNIQIPIVTLGSMRFQQTWNRDSDTTKHVKSLSDITDECQSNLLAILRHAIHNCGINHIETAQGYGTSELQLGSALSTLIDGEEVKREDLILQTKGAVNAQTTPQGFRDTILGQIKRLNVDYVDLFSCHGLNVDDHYTWLFEVDHEVVDDDNNKTTMKLIDVLRRLKSEGKIRHYGFSTHGSSTMISKFIQTNEFEYINIHHHWCGSYTASGDVGVGGNGGNLDNLRLCQERDMGVFIISPYDKGGRLYAPSNKLRSLTLPEMEPMTYGSLYLWQHWQHDEKNAPIHTIVCGAGRPSDLDQPALAAIRSHQSKAMSEKRAIVDKRIHEAAREALGVDDDWVQTWNIGVPNSTDSPTATQCGNLVWLYNVIRAYGMVGFAKDRYEFLNGRKWDDTKTKEENVMACGPFFHWVPGFGYNPDKSDEDYFEKELMDVRQEKNRKRVLDAMKFVHNVCAKEPVEKVELTLDMDDGYDMRPWTAFPERK